MNDGEAFTIGRFEGENARKSVELDNLLRKAVHADGYLLAQITGKIRRHADEAATCTAEHMVIVAVELDGYDHHMFRRARRGLIGMATNLPGDLGKKITVGVYRLAQKVVKFN